MNESRSNEAREIINTIMGYTRNSKRERMRMRNYIISSFIIQHSSHSGKFRIYSTVQKIIIIKIFYLIKRTPLTII